MVTVAVIVIPKLLLLCDRHRAAHAAAWCSISTGEFRTYTWTALWKGPDGGGGLRSTGDFTAIPVGDRKIIFWCCGVRYNRPPARRRHHLRKGIKYAWEAGGDQSPERRSFSLFIVASGTAVRLPALSAPAGASFSSTPQPDRRH